MRQQSLYSFLLVLFFIGGLYSNTPQYSRAIEYLDRKGEVFFKFYVEDKDVLFTLTNEISIDKVEGNTVFAYANREEFEKFNGKRKYDYEVLVPAGDLFNPPMSDYADFDPASRDSKIDKFPTYDGYITMMEKFQQTYPNLVQIVEVGTSVKNRKLLCIKISDNVTKNEAEPKILNTSTMHGDETAGMMCMLRMVDYLLKNYRSNPRINELVNSTEIWLCPTHNPDGTYNGGNNTVNGAKRTNANNVDLNRNYPCPKAPNPRMEKENIAFSNLEKKERFTLGTDLHGGIEVVLYPWACQTSDAPDLAWWKYAARVYADKTGYLPIGNPAKDFYPANGTRIDWPFYGTGSRSVCVEISKTKNISPTAFDTFWNRNKDAFIAYWGEALNGIRGAVTDSVTEQPIEGVKVWIENHDVDYSCVYSHDVHGDYYRPIIKGNYSVTFSHKDYHSRTISGVSVENDKATILDVKLYPLNVSVEKNSLVSEKIQISPIQSKGIQFNIPQLTGKENVMIYSISGKVIKTLQVKKGLKSFMWDRTNNKGTLVANGSYVLKISSPEKSVSKNFNLH